MEDQVIEQSAVENMNSPESPEVSASAAPESQENSSSAEEETSFDAKSLGSLDESDQFAALKRAGILGEAPATKNVESNKVAEPNRGDGSAEQANEHSAEEPSQQDETLDVTIGGKTVKMSKSELIAGYQRQADYTRKTQELAEERRKYDALIAQAQTQQTEQPSKPTNTAEAVQQGYESAVKMAAQNLGIPVEEFNQFDSTHQYALQQAILTQNAQKQALEHRNSYATGLIDQARQDPLCDSIMSNLDTAIGQMYCNPQTTEAAKFLSGAKDRFFAGQASVEDIQALEGLYNHVRSCIIDQSAKPAPTVKKEPPVTENPGTGNSAPKPRMDKRKLRSLHGDDQFAYLKKLGVFN